MKTKLIFLASVVGLNILVAACEPAPETQTTPAPAVPQGETPPPATTPVPGETPPPATTP
ncbi:hypothetical protein [Fischerella thermalis]|uniref:hypothetical protein n=1 Tax=Fischerella thermalis TaxID=372787 RepID=UPI0008FC16F4|nr:hypothetical protein [Fischerella thermalis]